VLLSADDAPTLIAACRAAGGGALATIARDSQSWFDAAKAHRLAIVARSDQDLEAQLGDAAARIERQPDTGFSTPAGAHYRQGPSEQGKTAFLFPGQGSQYVDMGAGLAMAFGSALEIWDQAASLEPFGGAPLHDVVFPPCAFDDDERQRQADALTAMINAQPAIAAVSLAQLDLVGRMGLRATAWPVTASAR
jgi:acyl transferase domain-containing protein